MKKASPTHPPLAILHGSFVFSGSGTLLCGSTLPAFAQQWHLTDAQCGILIAAQFVGLFLGALALLPKLNRSLLFGYRMAAVGFLGLSIASLYPGGFLYGSLGFLTLGLGLGQTTTSVNLISAVRYRKSQQRSSSLSMLNFTWSVGAVLSPLIAGFYLAHASLFFLLLTFAAAGLALYAVGRRFLPDQAETATDQPSAVLRGVSLSYLSYYIAMFFLYGGFEATIAGWLSTYTYRYAGLGMATAAYLSTVLWAAFAVGRAIFGAVLRVVPERIVRDGGLLAAVLAAVALRNSHTVSGIATCAIIIGVGMGPFFAITFSAMIDARPSPRQAGAATANVALGSAAIPYLTGLISTRLGSLQIAMLTPVFIGLAVFLLGLIRIDDRAYSDNS